MYGYGIKFTHNLNLDQASKLVYVCVCLGVILLFLLLSHCPRSRKIHGESFNDTKKVLKCKMQMKNKITTEAIARQQFIIEGKLWNRGKTIWLRQYKKNSLAIVVVVIHEKNKQIFYVRSLL